ncbi:hypothetical protein AusDCA_2019 [Desulfitobacterium sp. AusDCA]
MQNLRFEKQNTTRDHILRREIHYVRMSSVPGIDIVPIEIQNAINTPFRVLAVVIVILLSLFIALNAD